MNSELIFTWENPKNNEQIPVGRLSFKVGKYIFQYTYGAKYALESGYFKPFSQMEDLDSRYVAHELFPIFKNRLLQKSRPEYDDYLSWLNLPEGHLSPIDELAKSGGGRVTDNLQLYPLVMKNKGFYDVTFYSHGIRNLAPNQIKRIDRLNPGAKLYFMQDIQNNTDSPALALRTDDPPVPVGYAPRFWVPEFKKLANDNGPQNVIIKVEKINRNAPLQFKLLCRLKTIWPDKFKPFDNLLFQKL